MRLLLSSGAADCRLLNWGNYFAVLDTLPGTFLPPLLLLRIYEI